MVFLSRASILVVAMSASLCGCDRGADSASEIARARSDFDKRDYPSASVGLRALLQREPNSAEGRFAFGRTLLAMGEPASAAVELKKALELRHPAEVVMPLLAQALSRSGQYRVLLELPPNAVAPGSTAEYSLNIAQAEALAVLGKRGDAEALIAKVLTQSPNYAPAILYRSRLLADAGKIDVAIESVQRILKDSPADVEALRLAGDLSAVGKRDQKAAVSFYQLAVDAAPDDALARSALIYGLVQQHRFGDAEKQFEQFSAKHPTNPQTRFFGALFAFLKGRHERCAELLQPLLQRAPDNVSLLQLAGANATAAGSLVSAETYLSKALKLAPASEQARGMLARVYMRNGIPLKAVEILQPLLETPEPAAGALSLAGEAQLAAGNISLAQTLFAKAIKRSPQDTVIRVGQARAALAAGQEADALSELVAIANNDPGIEADMILIGTQMDKGDWTAAVKSAEALQKKRPSAAFAANLRAEIALRTGDRTQSRAFFEQAAKLGPDFFPAAAGLASLDIDGGNITAGRKRLADFIAAHPRHSSALLALAETYPNEPPTRTERLKAFQAAVDAAPDDARAREALISQIIAVRDFPKALAAARDAAARFPQNISILAQLAQTQFLSGDTQQAISTISKWIGIAPKSPAPHVRMAELWLVSRDYDAARAAFLKAQALQPDSTEIAIGLIKTDIAARHLDKALLAASDFERRHPASAAGAVMSGDVHVVAKNTDAGIAAYRRAISKSDANVSHWDKLMRALLLAGKTDAADEVVRQWLVGHPRDVALPFVAGQLAMDRQDWAASAKHFRTVLGQRPEDAAALNNLAWTLLQLKQQGAAEAALKATSLRPDVPHFFDTLAAVQAADGKLSQAIETQKAAVAKPGGQTPKLRLSLARLLIKAEKNAEAAAELEAIKATATGEDAAQAARLLSDLALRR
jgi:putative PEP-CTERM system TPR-repeat lipoprotein